MPSHNREAWEAKFSANRARDQAVDAALQGLGLKVITIWECEVKDPDQLKKSLTTHLR